jgi:hypothetical protein
MAEGFRVTEDGTRRVTESSDSRITEGVIFASSSLAANGTLSSAAILAQQVSTTLDAVASVVYTASQIYNVNFVSGVDNFTRITEAGDRRVTEDGSVRITDDVPFNSGQGVIISFGDLTQFNSEPYVKVETDWKRFLPYVKYEDNWQVPERIYKNINGNWKRIF